MDISKWMIAIKLLFGGVGAVASYVLDLLNKALAALPAGNRVKIQAVLNLAERVLSVLTALKWLCPTKWQTAYGKSVEAVETVVAALADLNITVDEIGKVRKAFAEAVASWKGDDDETCVDCVDCDVG
jgi:hypothetical protein